MKNNSHHSLWSPNHYELTSRLGKSVAPSENSPAVSVPTASWPATEQVNNLLLTQIKQFLPNLGPVCSPTEMAKWRQDQTLEYIENHPQEFLQFTAKIDPANATNLATVSHTEGEQQFSIQFLCDEKKLAQTLKHSVFPHSSQRLALKDLIMWIITKGLDSVEHLVGLEGQHDQLTRITRLVGNTMMFCWNKKLQQNLDTMTAELAHQTGREAVVKYHLIDNQVDNQAQAIAGQKSSQISNSEPAKETHSLAYSRVGP